jgi:GxxExxY protein
MYIEEIFKKTLDCSFAVHTILGPGLLEKVYEECLVYELNSAGLYLERQKSFPLIYKKIKLDIGYRLDLIVEKQVIIELKTIDNFNEIHLAQILTYMKLSSCKLGLLVNFNVRHLKDGIKRVIL